MTQHAVDLAGEPLEGMQVMGLLESRGLDFDEVFVLDVNEGTLPDGAPPPSFMPLDLQRSIGLPGRPERDGIFSAYLHRLLHRSRKVHLLCVGADLGDSGTEPSRFLGQLKPGPRPPCLAYPSKNHSGPHRCQTLHRLCPIGMESSSLCVHRRHAHPWRQPIGLEPSPHM